MVLNADIETKEAVAGGAPTVSESKDLTSNDSTKAVTKGVAKVMNKEKTELSAKPVIETSGTTKKAASKSATSPEFVELTEDTAATTSGAGEAKAKAKIGAKKVGESLTETGAASVISTAGASKKAASKSAITPEFVELTEDTAKSVAGAGKEKAEVEVKTKETKAKASAKSESASDLSGGASKKAASKSATSPEFVELTEDTASSVAGADKAKAKTSVKSESASEASGGASKKASSKSAASPEFVELTEIRRSRLQV